VVAVECLSVGYTLPRAPARDVTTYREPARRVFRDAGADRDQGVVVAAVKLLKASEQTQPGITGSLVGQPNAHVGRVLVPC